MTLGDLIGRGRTADVYAWTPGHVLKLYHEWWPLQNVEFEARVGCIVHSGGAPSPAVGEIVSVDGRPGLVYERLDGPDMAALLLSQPERVPDLASLLARVHVLMHAVSVQGLPAQRERLRHAITHVPDSLISPHIRERTIATLDSLEQGTSLCHGDFHPGNVIMLEPTPTVIDWENASIGSPLADVARTSLLFETAHLSFPAADAAPVRALISSFHTLYLNEYISLTGLDPAPLASWRIVLAVARLAENIVEEQEYLASLIPA